MKEALPSSKACSLCSANVLQVLKTQFIDHHTEYLSSGVNEGDMADHTPPLESGQLLSSELPLLASPPPQAMVNGEGPQQLQSEEQKPPEGSEALTERGRAVVTVKRIRNDG
ncbi:hypothetical protein D9C73_014925 [Collichthys lucidus]|uniref:Uncharacterized protein n=1 Tax=Collichthys lucidus TaxID=240159 RepID=A0A4U5V110_COLLU|nr:hypothetical protein D9C73_014925 [Collichthys lucidus]